MDEDLLFPYQIQMDRLLNRRLHHSKTKMTELDNFLCLMLFYFLNRNYEQNP